MKHHQIIQGGMGAGVSSWQLARSVASRGQIGVVSGAGLDLILARRLQTGDPGGHVRRALEAFPDRRIADRIIDHYFVAGGKPADQAFASKPIVGHKPTRRLEELIVAGNFVEVFLAREGHDGTVGINYLHKIQTPLLPSLYGAMLAGVDIVIVGAGIPLEVPGMLDSFSRGEPAVQTLHVRDAENGPHRVSFDPMSISSEFPPSLRRPRFFPIVSSAALAGLLVKKCKGAVDGLIVEAPSAGGHNAPPRVTAGLSSEGEPVYGPKDAIDVAAISALGIPFWMAGSFGTPGKLTDALAAGAEGIQVGTLFAFCEESGLRDDLKRNVIARCQSETPAVFTDPLASPTGFPFKVLSIPGTLSDREVYANRERRQCDLGYLREAFENSDGALGWRCPAEDPDTYVAKGGAVEDTIGRKCLCNSLFANIGLGQVRDNNTEELPLVTCGDEISSIRDVLPPGQTSYTSSDVIDFLLATCHRLPETAHLGSNQNRPS